MKYFTTAEFIRSKKADEHGIDNRCRMEHLKNIQALVDNVLDPVREQYGKPIQVTSGFRCPELNKLVGGVHTSDHLKGRAADIVGTPNTKEENRKLFRLILNAGVEFDQLIEEHNYTWIHVGYREGENRKQVKSL